MTSTPLYLSAMFNSGTAIIECCLDTVMYTVLMKRSAFGGNGSRWSQSERGSGFQLKIGQLMNAPSPQILPQAYPACDLHALVTYSCGHLQKGSARSF